jgi:hypothetical protein
MRKPSWVVFVLSPMVCGRISDARAYQKFANQKFAVDMRGTGAYLDSNSANGRVEPHRHHIRGGFYFADFPGKTGRRILGVPVSGCAST